MKVGIGWESYLKLMLEHKDNKIIGQIIMITESYHTIGAGSPF